MDETHDDEYWYYGLNALSYDNFIALNRTLVQAVGLNCAVLVSELISEARYWAQEGHLEDGWFFTTIENVSRMCGLSKYQQGDAMKDLVELGLVEVDYHGVPRKRFVRVNTVKVIDLINSYGLDDKSSSFLTTVGLETRQQLGEKLDVNNNNNNKNNNKNKEKKSKAVDSTHADEIRIVVDYLNEKVGSRYTYRNKEINRLIRARLKDGFTVDDFKAVIDGKSADWKGDPNMSKYLRPSTLFAPSHFEEYLNESMPQRKAAEAFSAYSADRWQMPVEHRAGVANVT